jgi:hypothetical protein
LLGDEMFSCLAIWRRFPVSIEELFDLIAGAIEVRIQETAALRLLFGGTVVDAFFLMAIF